MPTARNGEQLGSVNVGHLGTFEHEHVIAAEDIHDTVTLHNRKNDCFYLNLYQVDMGWSIVSQ